MKLNERNSTGFYHFPCEETEKVMADMAAAEKAGDLKALKRCARLLQWLYEAFKDDPCGSDEPFDFEGCRFPSVKKFNAAWKKEAAHV